MSAGADLPASVLAAAGFFLLAGAAIAAWPRQLIRFYIRLLRPMRSMFGSLVDWEIRLLESRAAPWIVRLFGLFVILSGASIVLIPMLAARAG